MKFIGICLLFVMSACGLTVEEERSAEEPFHTAVESWIGANIEEMVETWGRPDEFRSYNGIDEPMIAYWEFRSVKGGSLAGSPGASTRLIRKCEAFIVADEAGTILTAEAKTDRCVEFLHDRIAGLRR